MIKEGRETSKRAAARCLGVDVLEWVVSEDKLPGTPRKRQRMDGAGIYLAHLLNLPPRGAYSDAKLAPQLFCTVPPYMGSTSHVSNLTYPQWSGYEAESQDSPDSSQYVRRNTITGNIQPFMSSTISHRTDELQTLTTVHNRAFLQIAKAS